jgi:hypothetical protein
MEVVDVQTEVTHCALAAITVGVKSFKPKLNPFIVSIAPEQVGKFSALAPLIKGASKDFKFINKCLAWHNIFYSLIS